MHATERSVVPPLPGRTGPQRPWLKSYPRGVPAEINPDIYRSLVGFFDDNVHRYASRPAFSNFGKTLSYSELERHSLSFAAFLQNTLSLEKGERIAIMLPNVLQYPIALFGALRAGLVVVNTNPLYTPRELTHQLNDAGVRTIVVLDQFAHVLAECIAQTRVEHIIVTRLGDLLGFPKGPLLNGVVKHVKRLVPEFRLPAAIPFPQALATGSREHFVHPVEIRSSDAAFLQYTGGTTGLAKGAMLTHRNMLANVEQSTAWLRPRLDGAEEAVITALPLYHIFALTANCFTFMNIGGLNHLVTNPRDLEGFVRTLRKTRFTAITGVNTLFNGLLQTPGFHKIDFSPLKVSLAGGAALQESVASRWKSATGSTLVEGYGLTEASPIVCVNPLDASSFSGCIGLPVPSTDVSIRDEKGQPLDAGQAGELWVRGPQVMPGYWQQPAETAAVLSADGWLRTGDIAEMLPDGYVRLLDRKKDMILVSGFNVYPNEVEGVISAYPGVGEAGVIGIPDEQSGEAIAALVVRKDPTVTEQGLRDHCRKLLTAYKRPKHIRFVAELPKNNIGKILRRELRDQFVNTTASTGS